MVNGATSSRDTVKSTCAILRVSRRFPALGTANRAHTYIQPVLKAEYIPNNGRPLGLRCGRCGANDEFSNALSVGHWKKGAHAVFSQQVESEAEIWAIASEQPTGGEYKPSVK